jgi:hypothetical protein
VYVQYGIPEHILTPNKGERQDLVTITHRLYTESEAEAVVIVSNPTDLRYTRNTQSAQSTNQSSAFRFKPLSTFQRSEIGRKAGIINCGLYRAQKDHTVPGSIFRHRRLQDHWRRKVEGGKG